MITNIQYLAVCLRNAPYLELHLQHASSRMAGPERSQAHDLWNFILAWWIFQFTRTDLTWNKIRILDTNIFLVLGESFAQLFFSGFDVQCKILICTDSSYYLFEMKWLYFGDIMVKQIVFWYWEDINKCIHPITNGFSDKDSNQQCFIYSQQTILPPSVCHNFSQFLVLVLWIYNYEYKQLRMDSTSQCVPTIWWFILQPQVTLWCQLNDHACKKYESTASEPGFHWPAIHRLYFQPSIRWNMLEYYGHMKLFIHS